MRVRALPARVLACGFPLWFVAVPVVSAELTADEVAAVEERQIEALLANKAQLEARLAVLEERYRQRRLAASSRPAEESAQQQENIALISGSPPLDAAALVLTEVLAKTGVLRTCLDYVWLLVTGALVMFMQAGFAILETGSVRSINAGMVMTKNILDTCLGTLAWYFVGYGLAYGVPVDKEPNEYYGERNFVAEDFLVLDADGSITGSYHFKDWFFQWAFSATCATIVSGGVAERVRLPAYALYSVVMTACIYPVIVYWTWSGYGWLSKRGYSDFAGSGIIHLPGGIAALVGAALVGPRNGRWEKPDKFAPHNVGWIVLGTFILWFGWYGFNCGSTLTFSDVSTVTQAALIAMNTTLSAASGGIVVLALRWRHGSYDLAGMCNGILAGLVAVCAGVNDMMPEYALLTGLLGGLAYEIGHLVVEGVGIDDPLDAFAVHGCGGLTGVLTRPLFDRRGAQMNMWGWHIMAVLSIGAWSGCFTFVVFFTLRVFKLLRVPPIEERTGGDIHLSPGQAYVMEENNILIVDQPPDPDLAYGLDLLAAGGRMEYLLRDMEESVKSGIRSAFGIKEKGTAKFGLFKKEDYRPQTLGPKQKQAQATRVPDGTSFGERLEALLQRFTYQWH